MKRALPLCFFATALFVSACSANIEFSIGGSSLEDAAETLIEGTIADQFGFELTATCPPVADAEVGTDFTCTATTPTGDTIRLEGEVDREDHINVESTNAVSVDALEGLASAGAGLLEKNEGFPVLIDCGAETVVLDQHNEMRCVATDRNGDTATAIFTIEDTRTGDFFVRIGE